jgi:hypothetical protein
MYRKWTQSLLLGCPLVFGCAAASMMIKPPVEQKCAGYGLRGCDQLVDGVVLYVNGDKDAAVLALKRGAAANSPAQLRPFASAIKTVISGDTGEEIAEILSGDVHAPTVAVVAAAATNMDGQTTVPNNSYREGVPSSATVLQSAAAHDVSRSDSSMEHIELALAAPVDPSRLFTESVNPQREPTKTVCEVAGANATCVRKGTGPFVITDAVTPISCKADLFIGASDYTGKMSWLVQTNSPGFHGARFLLRSDQWLTVAARGVPTNSDGDERCIVTWAGFRPRMVPLSIGAASD